MMFSYNIANHINENEYLSVSVAETKIIVALGWFLCVMAWRRGRHEMCALDSGVFF